MVNKFQSQIDQSINYTEELGNSIIESRFVKREHDQTIAYLSSHNGCRMACRFCHLTATRQVEMEDVTPESYGKQLLTVLKGTSPTKRLNINFMARGEPLANKYLLKSWAGIDIKLNEAIKEAWGDNKESCTVKKNISTIVPNTLNLSGSRLDWQNAKHIFAHSIDWSVKPKRSNQGSTRYEVGGMKDLNIYWSLYSISDKFRKRWMPKAATPNDCIRFFDGFPVDHLVVHMAFIEGENDSMEDIRNVKNYLKDNFQVMPKINIVRYNPFSPKHGLESSKILEIQEGLGPTCKVVDRVGFDVAASCGMFLEK